MPPPVPFFCELGSGSGGVLMSSARLVARAGRGVARHVPVSTGQQQAEQETALSAIGAIALPGKVIFGFFSTYKDKTP